MTYEEFEWHILRMTYEEGVERLSPTALAYALGLPVDTVRQYLDTAFENELLEMDVTEEGRILYFVPGAHAGEALPKPVWKKEVRQPKAQEEPVEDDGGFDGSVSGNVGRPGDGRSNVPASLRQIIDEKHGTDGAVAGSTARGAVIQTDAFADEAEYEPAAPSSTAMVRYHSDEDFMPTRVETNDEAFCDPSNTMFMRQIRVYGDQPAVVLREQVTRLFQGYGYRVIDASGDRMRFERGSVMFILALVPLFVLVLPLFVYLFLFAMGRSTIQQEPVELDVQFRKGHGKEPFWDIDLTFVGLHGVVLGAADQKVLNREIDTLREELRWALAG